MNSADPIVIEQGYDATIASVWAAITELEQMRQWYFEEIPAFEPKVGFETEFNVHVEGKDFVHIWKVKSVVPEKLIAYRWRFGGFPGDSVVTWELKESGDRVNLQLTHTGQETFTGDPLFSRANGIAGWSYFVQDSLKRYLERSSAD